MAVNRTIVLQGNSYGHHDEGVLDTVATPGMHIQVASDGKYDLSPATAAELVKSAIKIVKEDALQGKTVDDAYAIGDRVFFYTPLPGDMIHCRIKTGIDLVIGDKVTPEGGGTGLFIEAAGTESKYRFEAKESTGGALAAAALIKCEYLG